MCAAQQSALGHEVWVASGPETGSEGSLLEEARRGPYHFRLLSGLRREVSPLRDVQALLQIVLLLWKCRPDLVHTHTSKAGLLGRVAARLMGIPVVHTPHGHVFHSYFSTRSSALFTRLERILSSFFTDALVMLSGNELSDHLALRVAPANLCYVIPSGVSLDRYLAAEPAFEEPVMIGYLGRLVDIKGVLDLVEAMPLVQKKLPAARWMLVGDGPLRADVEQRIQRLGLEEHTELLGWQNDPLPFLQRMHVLVVPSHNEGMGRVVVEAMAMGLPVVASRVGGLQDLLLDGVSGSFCEPANPSSIADSVLTVLSDSRRAAQMGHCGRERSRLFSDEVMFERLEKLYARVMAQSS